MPEMTRLGVVARRLLVALALLGASGPWAAPAMAQTTPPAAPAPTVPAPSAPAAPAPEVAQPPADSAQGGEIRDVAARPVVKLRGQSTWDEGFEQLRKSFGLLEAEARRLNLPVAGKPMAHFVDSDDLGFTYEAMLPLAEPAAPGLAFGQSFSPGLSPAGRAILFPYDGAYDDIDSAYEAITALLDEKGLTSTGTFLEEYEVIPEKSDDAGLKLGIVVFLK